MPSEKAFENPAQRHRFFILLRRFGRDLLFLGVVIAASLWWMGFFEPTIRHIRCDAEQLVKKDRLDFFYQKGNYFSTGSAQSSEAAFEGNFSVKLDRQHPFGMSYEYAYLKGNEEITASVWRFAKGSWIAGGKIVGAIDGKFWQAAEKVIEKREDGWEKIQFTFVVPNFTKNELLKLYCWNPGSQPVYFDNFHIVIKELEPL